MKKIVIALVLALMIVSLIAVPVFAKGKSAPAGKSNMGQVFLVEKNPIDWSVIQDGAWGQFNYEISVDGPDTMVSGVFNGKGLEAGTEYSLIYYPELEPYAWPRDVYVLGTGTANGGGNVNIAGSAVIGLPDRHGDPDDIDYYPRELGDKIWLVLSADLTMDGDDVPIDGPMTGWTPEEYLFEDDLINTALLLIEKDPADWSLIEDGAWGIFVYKLSKGGKATEVSGDFYGYGLDDGDYSLIYYPEVAPNPWEPGGYEVVVIGEATASGGEIEIEDISAMIGFPDEQPTIGDYVGQTGDKIWLVPSDDIEDGVMNAWNPTAYLFEAKLINTGK